MIAKALATILFVLLNFSPSTVFAQSTWNNTESLNMDSLNNYIIKEINILRKKKKVDPLVNEKLLLPAANDHAEYMNSKSKLTHIQRFDKKKKTPKNRVNFYGQQFELVGENVQQWDLNIPIKLKGDRNEEKTETYERLAKALVLKWKNSKGHYANMMDPDYTSTFTSVKIDEDGRVYACQLLGNNPYTNDEATEIPEYKPERPSKCWRCGFTSGWVSVTKDSLIVLELGKKTWRQRLAMFRRFADGYAADIVLKDQYVCDSANVFNGMRAVDGIPLAPVYKKDFRSDRYKRKSSYIILGEVPSYIDQEFEVNLTVISNKRTCSKTLFHIIPAYFSLTPSLEFKLDTLSASAIKTRVDILTEKIMYGQDDATISDSLMRPVIALLEENDKTVVTANVSGYASIEGSTENNLQLQKTRAENILKHLGDFGISEASVNVKTSENFEEFRTDIKGTEFEELGNLSNAELKTLLLDRTKMLELEPILKNHRYAKLTIGVRWTEKIEFDLDTVQYLMKKAVANLSVGKIREAQSLQAKFAVNGELTVDDLYEVEIPRQKKFIRPLYNRLILQFYIDSTDNRYEALTLLRDSLASLITLDKSNKLLNTQHLIAEFETINFGGYKDRRKYMDKLKKRKFIDSKVHARLILKLASINDWSWWTSNGYSSPSNFMFKEVKKYVVPAGLSVEEKFQVARYYCFFHENKYAYSLTKSIVDDTDDPKNIIFFLKLIYLTDAHPDRKTYIRLFKKIQKIAGPEFCTFFNSPRLNFQIFKDPEVKEIYCEMCGDN